MRARTLIMFTLGLTIGTITGCAALDRIANGSDDMTNAGRAQIDAAAEAGPLAPFVAASGLALTTLGAAGAAYKKWRDDDANKKAIRAIQNGVGTLQGIDLTDANIIADLKSAAAQNDAERVERAIAKAVKG